MSVLKGKSNPKKRILLGLLALAVVAGIAITGYTLWLTSDVAVSDAVPVAKTIVPPTAASAAPALAATTAPTNVPATQAPDSAVPTVAPIAATTVPTTAPAPAPAAAQVYRIDATQSKASYTVSETFLDGNRIVDAVGVTSAVAGDILIDRTTPANSQVGEIVVDISQLTSDSNRRDNAIRRQWLESAKYPLATFNNAVISELPAELSEGTPFSFKITGDMKLHDTTQPMTWEVTMTLQGDGLTGTATTAFKMSSFNVDPPDIAGVLTVEDDVALTLEIVANAVQQ